MTRKHPNSDKQGAQEDRRHAAGGVGCEFLFCCDVARRSNLARTKLESSRSAFRQARQANGAQGREECATKARQLRQWKEEIRAMGKGEKEDGGNTGD
jgi:hypothetical protein